MNSNLKIIYTILVILLIYSCQKQWECYPEVYHMTCIKGADTIFVGTDVNINNLGNSSYFYSALKYYEMNGYSIMVDSNTLGSFETTSFTVVQEWEQNGCKCIKNQ